jgi:hypothetical protein
MFHRFGVGADDGLGKKRQAPQIFDARDTGGIEPTLGKDVAVVGYVLANIFEQSLQAFDLKGGKLLWVPPLRLFHLAADRQSAMALEPLMNGEQDRRDQRGIDSHIVRLG